MTEEFRTIETFPKYEINRRGDVRNKKTGRITKPNPVGETFIWLNAEGTSVHRRLVRTLRDNAFKN